MMRCLRQVAYLCLVLFLFGCASSGNTSMDDIFLADVRDGLQPTIFNPVPIDSTHIIHRGVFSNDLSSYYYVVSKRDFTEFDILYTEKEGDRWTGPKESFFNSKYNDHGISFSPAGDKVVFSSTRPVESIDIPATWHLWMSELIEGSWSDPIFIEIPNLNDKLISHPSLAPDGTLYFHASDLDYSNMNIYSSQQQNGVYQKAEKLILDLDAKGFCTPYISTSGTYLVFSTIGDALDLYYCTNLGDHKWSKPIRLPSSINNFGQGNPYLTPGEDFLLYAKESPDHSVWNINLVSTKIFLDNLD